MSRHIELNLLEQLLALEEYGTLSSAAKHIHLTQPTLSRSMARLEELIGVSLFHHEKNRITLNENGKAAALYAKEVLQSEKNMIERVRAFERSRHTISIGFIGPGPSFEILPDLSALYPDMTIVSRIADNGEALIEDLINDYYSLIVLNKKGKGFDRLASDDSLYAQECSFERLYASLPKEHPLSSAKEVSFSMLDGQTFLMVAKVGFWADIVKEKMPDSKFLLQNDIDSLDELVRSSSLLSFATNITMRKFHTEDGRIRVPFSDPEAAHEFYLICKQENYPRFEKIFQSIIAESLP